MSHPLPKALVLTSDRKSSEIFRSILQTMEVRVEVPTSVGDMLVRLARSKYDAVVIDCDIRDATDMLETIRRGRSNCSAIVFAVVGDKESAKHLYELGANFVINKPLAAEVVSRSFRAAYGLILRERRRYARVEVNDRLHLIVREEHALQAILHNVSSGGLCAEIIQGRGLRLNGSVRVRFDLPHSKSVFIGQGEIVWSTSDGNVGIKFTALDESTRTALESWINKALDGTSDAVPAARVKRATSAGFHRPYAV